MKTTESHFRAMEMFTDAVHKGEITQKAALMGLDIYISARGDMAKAASLLEDVKNGTAVYWKNQANDNPTQETKHPKTEG